MFVSIIVAKYNIFPQLTMAACAKKKSWPSDLFTLSACTNEILSTLMYTEFDCAALLAMLQQLLLHLTMKKIEISINR